MPVELPPQLETTIRAKVAAEKYPVAAAVIAEVMRLLQERDEQEQMQRLRAALQIGIERGEVVEWTPALYQQIVENARRKAREGKLPKADVLP